MPIIIEDNLVSYAIATIADSENTTLVNLVVVSYEVTEND